MANTLAIFLLLLAGPARAEWESVVYHKHSVNAGSASASTQVDKYTFRRTSGSFGKLYVHDVRFRVELPQGARAVTSLPPYGPPPSNPPASRTPTSSNMPRSQGNPNFGTQGTRLAPVIEGGAGGSAMRGAPGLRSIGGGGGGTPKCPASQPNCMGSPWL